MSEDGEWKSWPKMPPTGLCTYLCYPRLAWIATILLDAIVVFRIVLGTRFHLIVITSVIVDILICVVHICIHLMESTSWSILLLVRAKSALSVVMGLVFIVRLVGIVVTLLVHHLPRCLQSTIRYLLLCIKLFGLAHRRLLLFLHFQHLFLILQINCTSFHFESIEGVEIAATTWPRGRVHSKPRITLWPAETGNVLHQILLLHVLL